MTTSSAFNKQLTIFQNMEPKEARVAAFNFVRDILYGDIGSRNPYDVLEARKGTCSGKHALLKLFLEELDYEVQTYFAKHDFSKFPIVPWPRELASFQNKTLTDYHDFLKVRIENTWVVVDAIFDKGVKEFGFPITEWDGVSDIVLPVVPKELFPAEGDPEEHKKVLIAALPRQVQIDRRAFLSTLTVMLDGKRAI